MLRAVSLLLLLLLLLVPFGDPQLQDRAHADEPPNINHPFGTDEYGRDIAVRFLHGARWSLAVGLAAAAVVLFTGWALGGAAGFLQGATGSAITALAEIFLTVPWLYLLLAVRAALPLDLSPRLALITLVFLIALTSWARPALLVRALVMSVAAKGYVAAALALGVPRRRVFLRHILPATAGLFVTQALLLVPRFVLAEVTLTYLGLGSGLEASWGALLLPLRQFYLLESQWWKGLPALLMIPFFVGMAMCAVESEKRCTRL